MNFSRRFLGPSVECYRLSLEFETPPQDFVDVAANGGSSGGAGGSAVAASLLASLSSSPSKPIAAAAKPPSSSTLASSASSPPRQGPPQTLQSIEDQWRKRASADHRNYTSVVVEWSSNESAAVVGARAAAAVAVGVDESGGGGGAPTVERVSLSFIPSSSSGELGVSAKLSVARVRARLARLEFSRGGGGGGSAAAAPRANDASAAAAAEAPEHSHPVAAILASLPLGGLRRVRCCEGTVLEALEALLPAEVEVEAVAEEEEKEGGEAPEEAPALPASVPASLHLAPRHSLLRIRSLFLTRCGKRFRASRERERE